MAIKTGATGPYLVQPEGQTGVELDSRFFTPNTLIGGAPVPLTLGTPLGNLGHTGQTTVTRTKAGDPKAPITAMVSPDNHIGSEFVYSFNPNNPNGLASTFYGDQINIQTRYTGSISNPVAPSLQTDIGKGDQSVSGFCIKRNIEVKNAETIEGPRIIAAKTITVYMRNTEYGSCTLNYRKNNTQITQKVPSDGYVFYADPNSQYTLSPAANYECDGNLTGDSANVIGTVTDNIEISVIFYYTGTHPVH